MDIKPIKNVRDYKTALKAVDKLMNAKAGSKDGDKLDILVTLVEAYEEKHYKINAPDPVEAIRFVMEQQELERSDLEEYIGSCARVS